MKSPLVIASSLLFGCSALYGSPNVQQCNTNADCDAVPELRNMVCSETEKVCVPKTTVVETPENTGCVDTDQCVRENMNRPSVCRSPGQACVKLQSGPCDSVEGPWRDSEALFIGTVSPLSTLQADGKTTAPIPYTTRLRNAINLGLKEWNEELPSGLTWTGRPLAIVHCDSRYSPELAVQAVTHLVDTVRTPVIIAGSDFDMAAAAEKAVASNTALACADCIARPSNAASEAGLAWRIRPELAEHAALAAWRVADLEARIRVERGLGDGDFVKVALFTQWGEGFADFAQAVRSVLRFNGKTASENGANYRELRTPNPAEQWVSHSTVLGEIAGFAPDVIVVGVDTDFTSYYLPGLENCVAESESPCWPEGKPRPHYVLTVYNQEINLLAPIIGENEDLRKRISGAAPYLDTGLARNLAEFTASYKRDYLGEDPGNTQNGYDAFYATAYALVVSDVTRKFDGLEISRGFERQIGGARINVGKQAIPTALVSLYQPAPIDLAGASSSLDWDVISHRVSADIGLWCLLRRDGSLEIDYDAGPRWNHETGEITGAYECP